MEFEDGERRNIHDDLDELLDEEQKVSVKGSSTKKKVVFTEQTGSGQKGFGMKLDMDKLNAKEQSLNGEGEGEGDGTTAKKKKKKNRKKKNKNGTDEVINGNDPI